MATDCGGVAFVEETCGAEMSEEAVLDLDGSGGGYGVSQDKVRGKEGGGRD